MSTSLAVESCKAVRTRTTRIPTDDLFTLSTVDTLVSNTRIVVYNVTSITTIIMLIMIFVYFIVDMPRNLTSTTQVGTHNSRHAGQRYTQKG